MNKIIYVEKHLMKHPRVQSIIERHKNPQVIECEYYGELFNPKAQNFRQQKQAPALILAEKKNNMVLPTPEGFGIGGNQNYYFSHMLNCVYDCRYCFLQGLYQSANHLLFINYEDFMTEIEAILKQLNKEAYFFSGYDCDSLASEPISQFVHEFMPYFAKQPQAILELRTKSTNIKSLLKTQPIDNCVVAFSFTPDEISRAVEHKVPSVSKRIKAIKQLVDVHWKIGLRFDPLIYHENFNENYRELFEQLFAVIDVDRLHSISVGPMRFPVKMFQKLVKLYPRDKLLAEPLEKRDSYMTYSEEKEKKMLEFILTSLQDYVPKSLIFNCHSL